MDPQNVPQVSPATSNSNNDTLIGVLSYLGVLVIIAYFMRKDSSFVTFHVKQGLALFGIEVIILILGIVLPSLGIIWELINLVTLVFVVLGIINVVQGKEKELPLIGDWARGLSI